MARHIQLVVGLAAMMLDFVAIFCFVRWFSQTDWLFGHTKEPPAYIIMALRTATSGVVATIAWFTMALFRKFASSTTSQPDRDRFGRLQGIMLGVFLLPTCLIVLYALAALPSATETQRTKRLQNTGLGQGDAMTVSELIQVLEQDKSLYHRLLAVESLERMGPAAEDSVPALITALDDPGVFGRFAVPNALAQIGPAAVPSLTKAVRENAGSRVRGGAATALGLIGPTAKEAVPALQEALHDVNDDIRLAAAQALERIGPTAKAAETALSDREGGDDQVMVLAEIVAGSDGRLSGKAARQLGRIGPAAKKAIPALRVALMNSNAGVRLDAAYSLWLIEHNAEEVVPVLAALLEVPAQFSYDTNVPATAAYYLSNIGPEAEAAVPALTKALQHAHGSVRETSTQALGSIGPAAKSAVPVLIETIKLSDPNSATKTPTLPNGPVPEGDTQDKVTGYALKSLARIDTEAARAIIEEFPHALEALKQCDYDAANMPIDRFLEKYHLEALRRIDSKSKAVPDSR